MYRQSVPQNLFQSGQKGVVFKQYVIDVGALLSLPASTVLIIIEDFVERVPMSGETLPNELFAFIGDLYIQSVQALWGVYEVHTYTQWTGACTCAYSVKKVLR